MSTRPGGTITLLFTQVEGNTLLWARHPQHKESALARQEAILRDAVELHGGDAYKHVSGFLRAAFPTAAIALQAALSAQQTLAQEQWPVEVGALSVKMALHTGAAEQRDGDYLGPLPNRTERLLSAAHGGQVVLSSAAAALVRAAMPEGATLLDLGEHRLPDLTSPEHIFQLAVPDLPSIFPPLKTLERARHNLPLQPTALIGRVREVAEITQILEREDVRLLTLLGPGGIGKTRLSLQVAAEALEHFRDGVFFVSLASTLEPYQVISAVAGTLGVRETAGRTLTEALQDYLRDRELLLVLDNFEQVVEAAPVVADLLDASAGLKVLVTSRSSLNLTAEHQYAVPPLALPDPEHLPPVSQLSQFDAVALFVERARGANPTFDLNDANALPIAMVCARLDGLPLAIELAAARVKVLSPEAILTRLDRSLTLLTGGARDLPARQQTLRSTIEWSYELLDEAERTLFRRISVFQGGGALEALETVCAGDQGITPLEIDVLDGIGQLVDRSLLQQHEGAAGDARFRMLQSIQEYARERLGESGEEQPMGDAHAAYFMAFVERAEPELVGSDVAVWLQRLDIERDNLRAAHDWFLSGGRADDALALSGGLTRFWLRRGYFTEGRRQFETDLAQSSTSPTLARAKALHGAGIMAYEQGDHTQAKAYYEEAASMRRLLGDEAGLAASLNNLANVALYQEEYEQAARYYEEALDLLRRLDNKWGVGMTLGNMGWIGLCRGDYAHALSLYEESLRIRRDIDDKWGIANSLGNMAWVAAYQEDFDLAQALTEEGIPHFEELGDRDSVSDMLDIQGRVAVGRGDYEAARRLFAESLKISQDLGDKSGVALVLLGFATMAGAQGRAGRSARLFGAADSLREATAPFQRAYFERHLAASRGQLDLASWEAEWRVGHAMTIEQAIDYALAG